MKNILILVGSPRKNGTSSLLADNFKKGAKSSENNVSRFDLAFLNINEYQDEKVFGDDFDLIKTNLITADAVAFVTPIYYFGMSAQLKKVIDRFHCISDDLKNLKKSTFLIATPASTESGVSDALKLHYEQIIEYLGWEDMGTIFALGVPDRETIERTNYPIKALNLGKRIS